MTMSFYVKLRLFLVLPIMMMAASAAKAQKAPELGYVFPPVVRAGETTDVLLGGYDFTPDIQFFVHHPNVKLKLLGPPGRFLVPGPPYWFGEKARGTAFPIPREVPARITVPKDTPPGIVRWQVANANGISGTASLVVSDGAEIIEKRLRDEPLRLDSLPISVSGCLEKITEVDRYVVKPDRDGPVSIDLMARRLGSDFHGMLEVRNEGGRVIASAADTEGLDTALTFAAKKGQTYAIRLHDLDFRGNRAFVYRLSVTPGPRVVATLPAHGKRGSTSDVTFAGYGVATGKARLETVRRKVSFPKSPSDSELRYNLKTPFGVVPVAIPLSDLPETTETTAKETITIPGAVTGTLSRSLEEDRYSFSATKGQDWKITLQSRAIGTRLDVVLQVLGPDGKSLATVGGPDAELNLNVAADGKYSCIVRDLSGHDGCLDAVYRLAITSPKPDYSLSAAQAIKIPLGGKATLAITAQRAGGFAGPITLHVDGLPAGISGSKTLTIPEGKSAVNLPLECAKDAAVTAALLHIVGAAKIGGRNVVRTVNGNGAYLLLAMTMKPPITIQLVDKNRQRAVHAGTTYPAELLIQRDDGYKGEVLLQMAARQGRHRQGITGPIVTVSPKESRALYPTFLPEWLETDRTTRMVVMGVAKVADPKGNVRYLTKPADARVTMILEGALLKLSHNAQELTVRPGESFDVPIEVSQSVKLMKDVRIEVVAPSAVRELFSAKPVTLAAGEERTVVQVQTRVDKRLSGDWPITIKATALRDGRWPVVSQTIVPVRFSKSGEQSRTSSR